MISWKRVLEWCGNLMIVALLVLIGFFLYKHHSLTGTSAVSPEIDSGMTLSRRFPGWVSGHRTLFLALSTDCVHCSNEALFYSEAARSAQSLGLEVLQWFPQSVDESRLWLSGHGVPLATLRQTNLHSIGVDVTPTIGIADGDGKIVGVWRGELNPREQVSLLGWIRGTANKVTDTALAGGAPNRIDMNSYTSTIQSGPHQLLDPRSRDYFKLGHTEAAVNIPFDELDSRAIHELVPTKLTVIDCSYPGVGMSFCELATRELYGLGFANVSMLVRTGTPLAQGDASPSPR